MFLNISQFHRKNPVLESLCNKVAGLQGFQHRCFPVNFAKCLRTAIFNNIYEWLLLKGHQQQCISSYYFLFHFSPRFHYYTPWKHLLWFLLLSGGGGGGGGMEMQHWPEIGIYHYKHQKASLTLFWHYKFSFEQISYLVLKPLRLLKNLRIELKQLKTNLFRRKLPFLENTQKIPIPRTKLKLYFMYFWLLDRAI